MGVTATMFVRNRGRRLSEEELQNLSAELLAELPYDGLFLGEVVLETVRTLGDFRAEAAQLSKELQHYYPGYEGTADFPDHLQIFEQDGAPLISPPDEQWIQVNLLAWYFAPDYQRGPWGELLSLVDALERKFPESTIWYGGDSSGFTAYELTAEIRTAYSRVYDAIDGR
ncbi:hypothetical protein ACQKH5_00215 [Hyphomonas sp. NPDC076900]|uniref:hypothetical protein n=1 Tax=unclassified Hyphomonas TaxID=2630699 RepID=UPI003CFF63EC